MSGPTAADERRFGDLVALLHRTELNAVVLDIKGSPGKVWYDTGVPLASATGAVRAIYPVRERLEALKEHDAHVIGRIVVFVDANLVRTRPEWAIRDRRGGVWTGGPGGSIWMNPFREEVWDYNIALAEEAAKLGFDEIHYDYVRFPDGGPFRGVDWGDRRMSEEARVSAIVGFLKKSRRELAPLGAALSAALFGFTTVAEHDLGIGQDIEGIARELDYVSPMVYPSHYSAGNFGYAKPAENPFEVVDRSLGRAAQRLRGTNARLRPWLQDFSLGGVTYGPDKVRAQMEASEGHDTAGWLLWNAANEYTEAALSHREPATKAPVVCLLPARNAAADLPGYFEVVARFCDAVVALDDGSTDETRKLLEACPLVKVLLTNPPRDDHRGWDDAANRNRLLAAAARLDPEWIISVDADERIDPGDAAALRDFLHRDALPGCAYGFRAFATQEDLEHYSPEELWVYRLFSYESGQSFPDQRLHFVPVPTAIPRAAWVRTTLRIQHLGGATAERRRARFEKYRQADPDNDYQADYDNLLREPGELLRWEPRPPDLHVLLDAVDEEDVLRTIEEPACGPVLSAVVISRDDEARIARAVASVVNQGCSEPFEVIVVTSGTDRTAEVVRDKFPEVTLVELPRPALPGEARNAGLRLAHGAYVTFPGSHVELLPGSLAARLRAHRLGYTMVTGEALNGTRTWAGWASYFLDHAQNLPGQPPGVLDGPPAHCSYARGPLLEVGGFPEDLRAGEDTTVNMELFRRGYLAYRDPRVRFTHHNPCRTPRRLLRHYFGRGRGLGTILLRSHAERNLLSRRFLQSRLLGYLPQRLGYSSRGVARCGPKYRLLYALAFPLVVAGAVTAWLGMWYEILRPAPGKMQTLAGRRADDLRERLSRGWRYSSIARIRRAFGRAEGSCDDLLVLVDKRSRLPDDYMPEDLVPLSSHGVPTLGGDLLLRREAAEHLSRLIRAAGEAGERLLVSSAYRSFEYQNTLFAELARIYGDDAAAGMCALPGHSQHQLGTTVDFTSEAADYELSWSFGDTSAGRWLLEHAHEHGFVLSYPKGGEAESGYQWEPWHYRYVGVGNARRLRANELSLQAFLLREGVLPR